MYPRTHGCTPQHWGWSSGEGSFRFELNTFSLSHCTSDYENRVLVNFQYTKLNKKTFWTILNHLTSFAVEKTFLVAFLCSLMFLFVSRKWKSRYLQYTLFYKNMLYRNITAENFRKYLPKMRKKKSLLKTISVSTLGYG